jgi:multimeric flavodoxin WrbA
MSSLFALGISGSPRKAATDAAVRYALGHLEDKHGLSTEYFSVRAKKINFCIHCDYCIRKKQGCVHKDDLQDLYPVLEQASLWVLGSPCYHGHISAQLKAILDRTRAVLARDKRALENKVGIGIGVGGDRNGGQELVLHTIQDFYLINRMIPVSGGAFGANLGGVVWSRDQGGQGTHEDGEGLASIRKSLNRAVALARQLHS